MFSKYHWFELGESLIDNDYKRAVVSFESAGKEVLEQYHKTYLTKADKVASNGCDKKVLSRLTSILKAIEDAQDHILLKELAGEAS